MKSVWFILLSVTLVGCGDAGQYNNRSYVISKTHVEEIPVDPVTLPEALEEESL